jgi:hypothetical protein
VLVGSLVGLSISLFVGWLSFAFKEFSALRENIYESVVITVTMVVQLRIFWPYGIIFINVCVYHIILSLLTGDLLASYNCSLKS